MSCVLRALLIAVTLWPGFAVQASPAIRTQTVTFAQGRDSVVIKGVIKGDDTRDYAVQGRAGQTMQVHLATRHGSNDFNVLPPGSNDEAIFIGSSSGRDWTGVLSADGVYKIRVYLARSAARRHEVAPYTLTVRLKDAAHAVDIGAAPKGDAKVPGTPFHATGMLPCRVGAGPQTTCAVGVIRGQRGRAEVHITLPGGAERVLWLLGDQVQSQPGDRLQVSRQADGWSIEINGQERFMVPDALVNGG